MTLRPPETSNKALISTTSSFVGEYEVEGFLIAHAWNFSGPSSQAQREEGPSSWNAFVVAFETSPFEHGVGPLPSYAWVPEQLTWYLSVLFGKRFDNHGLTETIGLFNLPNFARASTFSLHTLPHNSHEVRADFSTPLNLAETKRIAPLISEGRLEEPFLRIWQTAAKFYSQALQNFENDAEVAYLHLVTSIEILTSLSKVESAELYDAETAGYLAAIESALPDGPKIAKHFRSKLLAVKKRFIRTITDLVDADFFLRSESSQDYGRLMPETFAARVGAAYDLRSKYVHTGAAFGGWIQRVLAGTNNEVQIGAPVVESKEYGKTLQLAPTFIGLERIVRYCLLKAAEQHGAYVAAPAVATA